MNLLMNIIVLIFEVLYYALFMKFSKNRGNLIRYIITFVINTFIILIFGSNSLITYFLFMLFTYIALKYIVKTRVSLYDMLIVLIMLFVKLIIEFPFIMIFYKLLKINQFIVTIMFDIVKIGLLFVFKEKINECYIKMKKLWDNNNFYIRYIFSCSMFLYTIIIVILLVKLAWEV